MKLPYKEFNIFLAKNYLSSKLAHIMMEWNHILFIQNVFIFFIQIGVWILCKIFIQFYYLRNCESEVRDNDDKIIQKIHWQFLPTFTLNEFVRKIDSNFTYFHIFFCHPINAI